MAARIHCCWGVRLVLILLMRSIKPTAMLAAHAAKPIHGSAPKTWSAMVSGLEVGIGIGGPSDDGSGKRT
jgi:hypothetical protein